MKQNYRYKMEISVEPLQEVNPFGKYENAYFSSKKYKQKYCECIEFYRNEINIKGQRNTDKEINASARLYTKNSEFYFSILKALLFYYLKWGAFKLELIKIIPCDKNGDLLDKNSYIVTHDDLNQSFEKELNFHLKDDDLKKIFNVSVNRNDWITALIYYISSNNNELAKFTNAWKCFNHIYNSVSGNSKDRTSIKAMIEFLKQNYDSNNKVLLNSKTYIENLPATRLISCATNKQYKNVDSFEEELGLHIKKNKINYKDAELLQKIKKALDKWFEDLERKTDYEKKLENVEKDNKNKYRIAEKMLSGQINKQEVNNFDYLELFLNYCTYLRNKYFHGEYRLENFFLKHNDSIKELNDAARILRLIDKDLLVKFYFDELLIQQSSYAGDDYEENDKGW